MTRKEFDYSKLKGRIVEKYGTYTAFAKECEISKAELCRKLRNPYGMNPSVISLFAEKLGIDQNDIGVYFFTTRV